MESVKVNAIKVGITTFIAVVLLVYSIAWLKDFSFYSDKYQVLVRFNNSQGLKEGDPVMVSGLRRGSVDDLSLDGGSVIVRVNLTRDVVLKKDARIVITALELLGGKKIEINAGVSDTLIDHSKILQGSHVPDFAEMLEQVSGMATTVRKIILQIDTTMQNVNRVVGDEEFQQALKGSVFQLQTTVFKVSEIVKTNDAILSSSLNNFYTVTEKLKEIANKTYASLDTTSADIKTLTGKMNEIANAVENITGSIQSKEGTVGKLIFDDQIYRDLSNSLHQMDSLITLIKKGGLKMDVNIDLFD